MFKKLKKRKAFTLVETIVVVALITILMGCVVTFAGPVRRMIWGTNAKNDAITINKIISNYVERRIAYADSVNVVITTDCSTGDPNLSNGFNRIKNLVNGSSKDVGGMLVFKYIADPTDPFYSTYKVYDAPITSSTPGLGSLLSGTSVKEEYAAFTDDFYSDYQYFVSVKPFGYDAARESAKAGTGYDLIEVNALKHKAHMTIEIDTYNFTGDYAGYEIANNTLLTYFENYRDGVAESNNIVNTMPFEKIGKMTTSFALENVDISTKNDVLTDELGNPVNDEDGNPIYCLSGKPKQAGHKSFSSVRSVGTHQGSDIVIFYNTRNYGIS